MISYKEKLREEIGDNNLIFSEIHAGGVFRCPNDYFIIDSINISHKNYCVGKFISCYNCWNEEYKGEEINTELINHINKGGLFL